MNLKKVDKLLLVSRVRDDGKDINRQLLEVQFMKNEPHRVYNVNDNYLNIIRYLSKNYRNK
jgi:hypothetical protein